MPEIVKKMIPYMLMETDALAAWLERQAEGGLHLRSVGTLGTAYFRREEPKKLRYAIDFRPKGGLKNRAQRGEQLAALGWQQICYVDRDVKGYIYAHEDLTQRSLPIAEGAKPPKPLSLWDFAQIPALVLLCGYFVYIDEAGLWLYMLIAVFLIAVTRNMSEKIAFKRRVDEGRFPYFGYCNAKREQRCVRWGKINLILYAVLLISLCIRSICY